MVVVGNGPLVENPMFSSPHFVRPPSLLETLLSGPAHLDTLAPFGVDDLVRTDATVGIRVEDRVDDIATPRLKH